MHNYRNLVALWFLLKIESVHMILFSINNLDTLHPCFFSLLLCRNWPMENQVQDTDDKVDRKVDNLHADPARKVAILQRLARLDVPHLSHSGSNRGGLLPLAGWHISFPFRECSLS